MEERVEHCDEPSVIVTDRLTMQLPTASDFADMVRLWSNPDVVRYIGGRTSTEEEVWQRLLRYRGLWTLLGYGYWTIREAATNAFVGEIGFASWHRTGLAELAGKPEGGWVLAPSMQGKGYAGEALDAALQWLDQFIRLPSSCCIIAPENRQSLRLAARCGYKIVERTTYREIDTFIMLRDRSIKRDDGAKQRR